MELNNCKIRQYCHLNLSNIIHSLMYRRVCQVVALFISGMIVFFFCPPVCVCVCCVFVIALGYVLRSTRNANSVSCIGAVYWSFIGFDLFLF